MTRRLKITSGLILFVFVTIHLSNLAVAFFSVPLAETLRPWMLLPFTNPVGELLLLLSLFMHASLGLLSLYRRNTLSMTTHDAVQIISALLILPLLVPHVWGVVAGLRLLGFEATYLDLFRLFWIDKPLDGLRQVFLIVVIWIHGCIGLFTWLKLMPWWQRISSLAYPLAVVIPVMALLGFVEGGNFVLQQLSVEPTVVQGQTTSQASIITSAQLQNEAASQAIQPDAAEVEQTRAHINTVKWRMIIGYCGLLLLVFLARRIRLRGHKPIVEVHYANGEILKRPVGLTLLELANINDIPHANLCRGRARCGTCRVQILHSDSTLLPPSQIEQETLVRTNSDDDTRLACQLIPGPGVIRIKKLLPPDIQPHQLREMQAEQDLSESSAALEELDTNTPESPA